MRCTTATAPLSNIHRTQHANHAGHTHLHRPLLLPTHVHRTRRTNSNSNTDPVTQRPGQPSFASSIAGPLSHGPLPCIPPSRTQGPVVQLRHNTISACASLRSLVPIQSHPVLLGGRTCMRDQGLRQTCWSDQSTGAGVCSTCRTCCVGFETLGFEWYVWGCVG